MNYRKTTVENGKNGIRRPTNDSVLGHAPDDLFEEEPGAGGEGFVVEGTVGIPSIGMWEQESAKDREGVCNCQLLRIRTRPYIWEYSPRNQAWYV